MLIKLMKETTIALLVMKIVLSVLVLLMKSVLFVLREAISMKARFVSKCVLLCSLEMIKPRLARNAILVV